MKRYSQVLVAIFASRVDATRDRSYDSGVGSLRSSRSTNSAGSRSAISRNSQYGPAETASGTRISSGTSSYDVIPGAVLERERIVAEFEDEKDSSQASRYSESQSRGEQTDHSTHEPNSLLSKGKTLVGKPVVTVKTLIHRDKRKMGEKTAGEEGRIRGNGGAVDKKKFTRKVIDFTKTKKGKAVLATGVVGTGALVTAGAGLAAATAATGAIVACTQFC